VLDGVFDEAGRSIEGTMISRVSGAISLTTRAFPKADAFDVEIVVGEVELFAERDEASRSRRRIGGCGRA